jgi:hypothetical protein
MNLPKDSCFLCEPNSHRPPNQLTIICGYHRQVFYQMVSDYEKNNADGVCYQCQNPLIHHVEPPFGERGEREKDCIGCTKELQCSIKYCKCVAVEQYLGCKYPLCQHHLDVQRYKLHRYISHSTDDDDDLLLDIARADKMEQHFNEIKKN